MDIHNWRPADQTNQIYLTCCRFSCLIGNQLTWYQSGKNEATHVSQKLRIMNLFRCEIIDNNMKYGSGHTYCWPSWIRGRQHDNNCATGWSRKELRMRTRTRNLSCRNLWDRETSNISPEYGEKVCRKTQHGDATYLRQAEMEIHFRHAVPNVLRCTYSHISCARSETKDNRRLGGTHPR